MQRHNGHTQLVGTSPIMIDLQQEIDRVARSDAKVLITGESGSGKELVAQSVHSRSPRAQRPFVAVNCAGLPETSWAIECNTQTRPGDHSLVATAAGPDGGWSA